MLKSIIAFLLTGLIMACSSADRNAAITPAQPIDYTAGLTGKYPVTFYLDAGNAMNLPQGETSGEFDVSKVDSVTLFIKTTVYFKASKYSVQYGGKYGLKPSAADPKQFSLVVDPPSLSTYSKEATGTISAVGVEQQFVNPYGIVTQFKGKRG